MEVVYADYLSSEFDKNSITGMYGDLLDLNSLGNDIYGISYDDAWTVKRLLNGIRLFKNKRIDSIMDYLEIDKSLLNKTISDLSKTDLKFVLLAYLLINNKKIIIFDYFDVGLSYSDKKKLSKIIGKMKKDGFTIVILSNDLVFLDTIVDNVLVVNNGEILYNGKLCDLIKTDMEFDCDILEFIKLANKKGAKLDVTLDHRELLKDIYRGVSK